MCLCCATMCLCCATMCLCCGSHVPVLCYHVPVLCYHVPVFCYHVSVLWLHLPCVVVAMCYHSLRPLPCLCSVSRLFCSSPVPNDYPAYLSRSCLMFPVRLSQLLYCPVL